MRAYMFAINKIARFVLWHSFDLDFTRCKIKKNKIVRTIWNNSQIIGKKKILNEI